MAGAAHLVGQTDEMKTIGLLGGMSWESSVLYEELINSGVRDRLGGSQSADLLIRSYNFADIQQLQTDGQWDRAGELLAADAQKLEGAGAELILLCTNTMHKVADVIEAAIGVPFVHLADTTAMAIREAGLTNVGLLGTKFTMEQSFYRERLESHGLNIQVPTPEERERVHTIIFEELVRGEIKRASREEMLDIIDRLGSSGCQGVIAGCTEIELLVAEDDVLLPYFPTTTLHAAAAVDLALSG